MFQTHARGLQNCRNRGADDVLPVIVEIGVSVGSKPGYAALLVVKKGDFEHAGLRYTRR